MNSTTAINVDILSQWKGSQSLKKAESEFAILGGAAKKLGGILGITFAATEIINFGKESLKAYAANQKALLLLDNTLKNLGQGFASIDVNHFIDSLSLASGKTKEELIPAFQTLFIATKDVGTAQSELKIAMDVAAGTGKDLASVTSALGKGYLGNTTALTRLGAGLSKATLASKDMKRINAELSASFSGDATTAANSFQGQMDRLNVTMTEAKVLIGTDMVQAFSELSGNGGIGGGQKAIMDFANNIGKAIIAVSRLTKAVYLLLSLQWGKLADFNNQVQAIDNAKQLQEEYVKTAEYQRFAGAAALKIAAAKAITDKNALKTANALTQAAKDKLKAERDSLNLKLAGNTVDMQNIEIQAALQKGQTKEVSDVLLLQRAILTGNADQAEVLAQNVLKANGLVMDIQGNISSLGSASNPFADWPKLASDAINQIKLMLAQLTLTPSPLPQMSVSNPSGVASLGTQTDHAGGTYVGGTWIPNSPASTNSGTATVNINVTHSPDTVVTATQTASSNGSSVTLSRLNPFGQYGLGF